MYLLAMTKSAVAAASTPLTTDTKLILAAERLFAFHGLDGVSLRQINSAAGQRNTSGLQYHFGSKEALVKAVFMHRLPGIDQRRAAMIAEIKAKNLTGDLPAVVEAMFMPLAEELDLGGNDKAYVRFLAQFYSHPTIRKAEVTSAEYEEAYRLAFAILSKKLPAPIVTQRLAMITGHVIHALSDLEARIATRQAAASKAKVRFFLCNLLDTVVGALSAPISSETKAILPSSYRRRSV
jgi:AcrR family transcriptional regulator